MYYYGGYYEYLIFVIPAMIIALIAEAKVKSNYRKFSAIASRSGLTGADAASIILSNAGIYDVSIAQVKGSLTDHYNPRTKVINLSQGVYGSKSIAAIGIACHEAGHACQHAEAYVPLRIRDSLVPVCKIGSYAGIPLAIIGCLLEITGLVYVGIGLYSAILVFQLVTLPVEFNASRRALAFIEKNGMLTDGEELTMCRKMLSAAAMTYVASVAVALANLLRFISIFLKDRD